MVVVVVLTKDCSLWPIFQIKVNTADDSM